MNNPIRDLFIQLIEQFIGIGLLPFVPVRVGREAVGPGESFGQTLKRFKKQCQKADIFSDIRRSARYEKPSVRRKRKMQAASRRLQKALRKGRRW